MRLANCFLALFLIVLSLTAFAADPNDSSTWKIPGKGYFIGDDLYNDAELIPFEAWEANCSVDFTLFHVAVFDNGTVEVGCRKASGFTLYYSIVPQSVPGCDNLEYGWAASDPNKCGTAEDNQGGGGCIGEECDRCDSNYGFSEGVPITWYNPNSGEEETFCTPKLNFKYDECRDVIGYINDQQICADDELDCNNGFLGYIDTPDEAGPICVPSDYGDQIPTCDSNELVTLFNNAEGEGSFICTAADPPYENDPTENEPEESDIDGDDIPDKDDPDMDGDGDPNSTDPDRDGDGLANEDDPTPDGPGDDAEEPSVTGGGSCRQRPNCTGDAIMCNILYQNWESRCETAKIADSLEDGPEEITGFDPEQDSDVSQLIPEQTTVDISSAINSVFTGAGDTGSCPADAVLSMSFGSVPVPFTSLCNYATMINPLVLIFFSYISFTIIMRAFD